ncbi:MAG: RNA pseudouridine synthase [Tenericutes bacterium HGW-Tenericutes-4]|jgi:23S rRNA pseudouridine1911/1915/1917 synthase|nr:MAG: RNA pseudouridine synthase [Tenericutes bacterium HGW-Tenericutes-4]
MREWNITSDKKNKRLDVFLCEQLEKTTRSQVKNLIEQEKVFVNNKLPQKAGTLLKENDKVQVEEVSKEIINITPENLPLNIVFEDEYLAVINKKQGMVVHPAVGNKSGTLVNALLHHFKNLSSVNTEVRPGIVHRLDKDTSGLLVIAKNNVVHENLAKQIKEKTAKRIYRAIVSGVIKEDSGVIDKNLERSKQDRKKIAVTTVGRGKNAITEYKVLERLNNFTYVEFNLKTGRTHQIRVHAKHIGHPVLGDKTYGYDNKDIKLAGQLLHAYMLSFTHPITQEYMEFISDLPDYFIKTLKKLEN